MSPDPSYGVGGSNYARLVNDGIAESICSLSYPIVHQAAILTRSMGKGALLAKLDLKNAYCNIPVHLADRWLLSVQWGNHIYIDGAPLSASDQPQIFFTAVADALQWIMEMAGTLPQDIKHQMSYSKRKFSTSCSHRMTLSLLS